MRNVRFIAVGMAVGIFLAGCSSASEKAAEKLIERGAGGNVDVNLGDGGMSFESEDGSFSVDADGNLQIESEDGSFSMDSQGGKLTDGFPDVPLPDGELITSSKQTSDGETMYQAVFQASGDPADVFEGLRSAYEAAGYEAADDSVTQGSGSYMANASFHGGEHTVFVSVMGDSEDTRASVMVGPRDDV